MKCVTIKTMCDRPLQELVEGERMPKVQEQIEGARMPKVQDHVGGARMPKVQERWRRKTVEGARTLKAQER